MISIFLSGCLGRMGKVITSLVAASSDLEIVAGSDIRQDSSAGFPIYTKASECSEDFDVIIDFSIPAALPELFKLMRRTSKPAVICTTGLTDEIKVELAEISKKQAVFVSANMSLGINILIHLARQAASLLYPDFDLEILEAHHRQKVDAPSGTALMIADELNDELDHILEYTYDRSNKHEKRGDKELGLHAIRGGTIVGEHTVIFAGGEETLSIHHSAQSRDVFARGALAAARFLPGQSSGMYNMKDLINSNR